MTLMAAAGAFVGLAMGHVLISASLMGFLVFLGMMFLVVGVFSIQDAMEGGALGKVQRLKVGLEGAAFPGAELVVAVDISPDPELFRSWVHHFEFVGTVTGPEGEEEVHQEYRVGEYQPEAGGRAERVEAVLHIPYDLRELEEVARGEKIHWAAKVCFDLPDDQKWEHVIPVQIGG